jgi:lipoate-protein ligase A
VNPPSKLESLDVWWHDGHRSAAANLAFDEALVSQHDQRPVLRFYQWSQRFGEAWTMGYFQRHAEIPFAAKAEMDKLAKLDIARRWTGGGLVCHRGDIPYTLIVPADHWLAKIPATDSYRWIHERLAASIRESIGIAAVAQTVCSEDIPAAPAGACFAEPVHWDVVMLESDDDPSEGKKIAGAAQRRSRGRLLHQGSVILPPGKGSESPADATPDWRQAFARRLCESPDQSWTPDDELITHAAELTSSRYGARSWRERF